MIGGAAREMRVDEEDPPVGQPDEVALAVTGIVRAGWEKADSLDRILGTGFGRVDGREDRGEGQTGD